MTTETMTTQQASHNPPKMIGQVFDRPNGLPSRWEDWTFIDLVNDDRGVHLEAPLAERVCPECGKREKENAVFVAISPHRSCDPCISRALGREIREEAQDAIKTDLVDIVPPLYRETDLDRLPYRERQAVVGWKMKERAKGLWLVGDPGLGKTRCLCLLLSKLIEQGRSVRAFFHGTFGDELLEVIRSERSYRAWKWKITNAEILAIDDLFASKLTEKVESAIFEILDLRLANYRPTFVTTQLTAKEALHRFSSRKRCEAFYRRIEEFCEVVSFKQDKQTELEEGAA